MLKLLSLSEIYGRHGWQSLLLTMLIIQFSRDELVICEFEVIIIVSGGGCFLCRLLHFSESLSV